MRRWIALSIGLVSLAGCKQPASDHPAVTQAEATKIAEQAESNFTAGNVDAVMRQYADGAVMFDATHPGFTTDRKVQTGWAKDFVSMKPANYQVPDRQIQIVGPDAFMSSATEIYAVPSGTASPTITARFTDVYQRHRDGSWKIVHEHVSLQPPPPAHP